MRGIPVTFEQEPKDSRDKPEVAPRRIAVITLFPEMLAAITQSGITSRAVKLGLIAIECWNPRQFTSDRHSTVDDRPYGGGPGMVMMVQPLRDAIEAATHWAGPSAKLI